ncbi:MAG TPA: hypothetical protein VG963_21610 [Polyangiaceae bacterium]|nr:hypothetical protein [Polyangiaceae bacterium]
MQRTPDNAKNPTPVLEQVLEAEAIALGRAWAHEKARQLELTRAPEDWPDFWSEADDGPLPRNVPSSARSRLRREASSAARERWRELVAEARSEAVLGEETDDAAAHAPSVEAPESSTAPETD